MLGMKPSLLFDPRGEEDDDGSTVKPKGRTETPKTSSNPAPASNQSQPRTGIPESKQSAQTGSTDSPFDATSTKTSETGNAKQPNGIPQWVLYAGGAAAVYYFFLR
jgi:hypothetical protein